MAPEARGTPFLFGNALLIGAVSLGLYSAMAQAASDFAPAAPISHVEFTLPSLDGAEHPLAAHKGRPLLVHFFATWCEPCREELPALQRISERAGNKLAVVTVSVADLDIRVRRFFDTTTVTFPVLLDRDRAVARAWNVSTLPTTFVLDANLEPRLMVESDYAWDTVEPEKLIASLTDSNSSSNQNVQTNSGGSQ